MFFVVMFLVFVAVVAWWAAEWGRSVPMALIGSILLSPLIWAIVLLVKGRNTAKRESAVGYQNDHTQSHRPIRSSSTNSAPSPSRGKVVCPSCSMVFYVSEGEIREAETECVRCKTVFQFSETDHAEQDPQSKYSNMTPVQVFEENSGMRFSLCPFCETKNEVNFEDAKAKQLTCPSCWKTYPIVV